jgi:hypothetical protein
MLPQSVFHHTHTVITQPETCKLQQVCYHQADIKMCSHRLLRLGDRLAASCELHPGLMYTFHQIAASLQISSCSKSELFTDLMQLDEINRLDTTC